MRTLEQISYDIDKEEKEMTKLVAQLKKEMQQNMGKISPEFIERQSNKAKVSHAKITPNTRVCVITLESGHDLVGFAQVLDSKNDVELKGQEVAYDNAKKEAWSTIGSIAKVIGEF